MQAHPYQLFKREQQLIAVRIDSPQGRLITGSGTTSTNKLKVEYQNGDSQRYMKELLSRDYERQEVVWIKPDSGKVFYSDPGSSLIVNSEPEAYIYWGFTPVSVQDLPNVQQHLQVQLEKLVESLGVYPDIECRHDRLEDFTINGWEISLFYENASIDFSRRRSNGIVQKSNGISSVLFLLALKKLMPNDSIRNTFVIAFEDNTEVTFDENQIPTELLNFFGISDWNSIRPLFEAFQLVSPRYKLAEHLNDSDTIDDWF